MLTKVDVVYPKPDRSGTASNLGRVSKIEGPEADVRIAKWGTESIQGAGTAIKTLIPTSVLFSNAHRIYNSQYVL